MRKGCSFLRVRAGVLQLTIGISIVLTMLCGAMILLVYYTRMAVVQGEVMSRFRRNAESGIAYVMANRAEMSYHVPLTIDLFGEGVDSVELVRKPWGAFDVVVAVAGNSSKKVVKAAMIAAMPDTVGQSAMYVPENNAAVHLVGNTAITGVAYLPGRELRSGYIDGRGYQGSSLIQGEMRRSNSQLPFINTALFQEMRLLLDDETQAYQLHPIGEEDLNTSYSFYGGHTNYYSSDQTVVLEDTVSGNVIVRSGASIRVTAEAYLDNIILVAPEIVFEDGAQGRVQCFASGTIRVGRGSRLYYPSVLSLAGDVSDSTVVIEEGAQVEGAVIIPGQNPQVSSTGVLVVEKGAILHGMAYVNGQAEIRGALYGHISTRAFQATVGTNVFTNHIYDGEINTQKRSRFLPATLVWGNTDQYVIAAWLR